ncbi:MAG: thiamine pyrophosphate-binding protein [Chloroflexi bacterium]|nr:thiamine pyrophosphate-binding protein [Chloroflexota bacterium]
MIPSAEATELIARHRGDSIVVPTMTALKLWAALSPGHPLDLYAFGCMGKASSLGLGVALARPDRRVIVLDGDGSLLMNLGSLVTIAHMASPNLYHFVYEDGAYTTTGGQPIPGAGKIDLAAFARAAGYPHAYAFENLEELASALPGVFTLRGPVLVDLKVHHQPDLPPFPTLDMAQVVRRVARALEG